MSDESKEDNAFKLARAKSRATAKTLRLLLFVRGGWAFGTAVAMTVILTFFFHLNAPLAFAGSFIGALIIGLVRAPVGKVWQSIFTSACQEEGLWDTADAMATAGIEDAIKDILEGRQPQHINTDLMLKASNLQVLSIRKGDLKTAYKYSEFLYKNTDASKANRSYHENGLGTINIELGNYENGFQLLSRCLDKLEAENRADTPSYVTALLGMVQGSLDLERADDAERFLKRMHDASQANHVKTANTTADRWVQQAVTHKSIHDAFESYFSARLKELKGDPEAELELLRALDLVKQPEVMKKVILFYPEVVLFHAFLMIRRSQFEKAEKLAAHALDYYETKTVNRGGDYIKAQRTLAYARMKCGAPLAEELEDLLIKTRERVNEPHHIVALALMQTGEAWAKQGDLEKARQRLSESLQMRKRLFPENSQGIRETESILAGLPPRESVPPSPEEKATV